MIYLKKFHVKVVIDFLIFLFLGFIVAHMVTDRKYHRNDDLPNFNTIERTIPVIHLYDDSLQLYPLYLEDFAIYEEIKL